MKIKFIKDSILNEVYFSRKVKPPKKLSNLEYHYCKHVNPDYCPEMTDVDPPSVRMPMMSINEYDFLADRLSNQKASKLNDKNANIIGYTTKSGKCVKYQKSTGYMVAYVDDPINGHEAIALYKQPIKKFFSRVNTHPDYGYGGPLPDEK